MIEITFSQSAAGGLKLAKPCKPGQKRQGSIGVIGGTAQQRRQALRQARKPHVWTGVEMEGRRGDVFPLTLALTIGPLADMDAGMDSRRITLQRLFGAFPGVSEDIWTGNQRTLARLADAAECGEPVRVWVCENGPEELCGLYYLCHRLNGTAAPLTQVLIPKTLTDGEMPRQIRGTGDIQPEQFGIIAQTYGGLLNEETRDAYGKLWQAIAEQNAPLRALVNGQLLSVPEDFYDFMLRDNIPEGEFKAALLIGRTLGKLPGVSDRWLYLRIQAMVESGELFEVAPAMDDHPYSATFRQGLPKHATGQREPMMDHIHLTVGDLERAERFYDGLLPLLGFDLAQKETDSVPEHAYRIVEYHHPHVSIGLVNPREAYAGETVSRRRPGALHHMAFYVGSHDRVDEMYATICALGAKIVHPPRLYPEYCADYYAFFFLDTEGIELEIVCWNGQGEDSFVRGAYV